MMKLRPVTRGAHAVAVRPLNRAAIVATCVVTVVASVAIYDQTRASATSAFTAGNVVVYRVGDGTSALGSTSAKVFLDELSPSGALVQSVALPTTATGSNRPLTASGSANSEGLLTLSADSNYLVATGYDASVGTSSIGGTSAASTPRTVATVSANDVVNSSTALTDFSDQNNPRSAASLDGTHFWVGGAAGNVRYAALGATTSTSVTSSTYKNVREVSIFNNQLYTSADPTKASVTVATVGTGLPTSGSIAPVNLGFSSPPTQPFGYALLTLGTGSAPDTLYVADNSAGAVIKYIHSGSNWVTKGSVSVANITGLTANDAGGTVTIFATSSGSNATAGTLYSIVDSSGGTGTLAGSATLIRTAPSNEAFRGVAFAPGTVIGSGSTTTSPPTPPTIAAAHGDLPAALGDTTNPTMALTVSDPNFTPSQLTVTGATSNTTVAPAAGVSLSGTGATRTLTVTPGAVGYSTITLTVAAPDGTSSTTTVIYGVSADQGSSADRYYSGAGNLSSAIDVGGGYMLVGDDESNILRLYPEGTSSAPVKTFDFTGQLPFGTTEVDIEASARVGNTIYWTGSMSTTNSGNLAPSRSTLFAATISGSGASTTLTYLGSYAGLLSDVVAWDHTNGHGQGANYLGLTASSAAGVDGHDSDALDVEGLEFAPGSPTTAYVTFRAPLEPTSNRHLALVVPVTNLPSLIGSGSTHATFGPPILMDLGGLAIREIRKNADNQYLISAGTANGDNDRWGLYQWDGAPADPPLLSGTTLPVSPSGAGNQGAWETIVSVPDPLVNNASVQLVEDNGDTAWYGDGATSKDSLPVDLQKDLGRTFTYTAPVLPPTTTSITSSTATSAIGDSVTYTAEVAPASGSAVPAGTVSFADSGTTISTCSVVALSGGTATCTVSYSVAVGHSVVATYSGSSSFAGSTSTAVTESVRPWTLTITADDQTIDFGQAVPTFTYTVGGLMGGDALTTPPTCGGSGGISIGTYPIVCSDASAGSNYTINYVSGTLVINRAATSVSETADVNPAVTGQPVTITATVAAVNSSATPTGGTVEFSVAGTDLPGCANVALSARAATCTLTNGLAAGSFTIAASYGGSSDFAPSQSEDGALTEQVNPAATTTVLTVDHTAVVTGQSLSLTATIAATAPGRSTAGGIGSTVTFQADGINLPGCAAVAVSSSRAVCAVPAGFTMSHTITAAYSGDANFTASTATPLAETVAPADTSVALVATPNPAVQKQPVTYSATISVTAPGDGAPSGTVAFSDEAGAIADCASALVSTSAPYVATCSATAGDVGTEAITATYSGDSAFNGSTGQTSVTFNPGSPATIEISPTSATLAGGQVRTYQVTGQDAGGHDLGPVTAHLAITPDGTCAATTCTAAIPGPHTVTATAGTATTTAALTITAGPALLAPNDVVGAGDQLSQYGLDFLTDGDPLGDVGLNTGHGTARVNSLDATADYDGRSAYLNNSTTADPVPLNPTTVLSAGTSPAQRPDGSSPAISALLADTGSAQLIQFVRSTRLPTAAEQAQAGQQGWGGLHVVRYADDKVTIAVDRSSTNAPSGLSAADLVKIYNGTYQTWGDIPGYTGPAPTNSIVALLPAAGSDLRALVDADLTAANNGTAISYAATIGTVAANDYTAISTAAAPADAIVPFSAGALQLIGSGYFGATVQGQIAALTGTGTYSVSHPLYVIVRDTDVASTATWRGGSINWTRSVFVGTGSYLGGALSHPLLSSAGLTPDYADLGDPIG